MIKFQINAIGRLKKSPILDLINEYKARIHSVLDIYEYEIKKSFNQSINEIKQEESKLLLSKIPKNSFIISMDEIGKILSSQQFSDLIKQNLNKGYSSFVFIIGGANGLDDFVKKQSNEILAFGKMTLPHMLARLFLVEQIYRAECIMNNHPYNK